MNAAVCAAVFVGDEPRARRAYGANEWLHAQVYARRIPGAIVLWANLPADSELWVRDVARPFGTCPNKFYGGGSEL